KRRKSADMLSFQVSRFLVSLRVKQNFNQNNRQKMEEQKPKSVRTIGLIVSIFSGFIIFSNALGALASSLVGFGDDQNRQEEFAEFNLMEFMFDHYLLMCFIMVIIGV